MDKIAILISSGKTVFKSNELALLLGISNISTLRNFLQRLKKNNILHHHDGGLWTLGNYDILEFASKLRKKSYISLETVLQKEGVIFQDYSHTIFLVSDDTLIKKDNDMSFEFCKIKDEILFNNLGILNAGNYMIASKERAICDRLYLTGNYYFDHIGDIDISLMEGLSEIYNKSTNLKIKKIVNDYKKGNKSYI